MSLIRIVISDADGTLLRRGEILYPRDLDLAVSECAEGGIPFVIASGRTLPALRKIFTKNSARLIFFALDGAYISAGGVKLADFPIGECELKAVGDLAKTPDIVGAEFCTEENSCLLSENRELHESEFRRIPDEYLKINDISELPGRAYKIILFTKRGYHVDIPGLHAVYRGETITELVRDGVDKAAAAEFLLGELGIDASEAAAFGDSENDRTLLEFAGIPVTIYGSKHGIFSLSTRHTANVAEYVRFLLKSKG